MIDAYARAVGRSPAIVSYYREWGETMFDAGSLRAVSSRHAAPMITWDPTVSGWQHGQPSSIMRQIANGAYDDYLRASARGAARWRQPVFVRLAPEMNGGWSPWGVRTPGNSPALYIAAWRHVVALFRAQGARNVLWVWCPNVDDNGQLPFTQLYPGDRWLNWVALDGYNWGSPWDWVSFTSIFASSYDTLARMTAKPMMVGETGSGEHGGSKAAWITSTFERELPRFARIRALVWFNGSGDTGTDFSFNSSAASAGAFRLAMRSPRYSATAASLVGRLAPPQAFKPIPSPPPPKHGLARVLDTARRYWPELAAAVLLLVVFVLAVARRRARTTGRSRR